ncbi:MULTISPECIES: GNAT family N-acetyltransferase [Tatumella]|uniref:GNAT family N-acetyltransferase n=1 Tax=Tatumella punctata TaxID=399969 RepID=A0ABW1VLG3_9GAMM|nr:MULTISPECIES: GNAT family N-acetyltransferase [unclassified Tatumella]MBS0855245.1 GNAT family N-acetyltransferase [Tatumella sp. JGM16]MBS0876798.1 GNAT family N-acetyltransferase [Tatumella sp. JGM82]MBS0889777.1 GNAT family N-acetyltransferase [Tatumella sp. JGM94]MBS0892855.1 GNAT family N-acetyltransferase [Tatumella sp. JGM130]MBS0901553.1 GNAT family N-acetyltransferase [Tatumella sp. JGM100]
MSLTFRQVRDDEVDNYLTLVLAAYAPTKSMGIHFDAATTTREKALLHLKNHGVYGLYNQDTMVASVTIRYPWGPLPGPFGLPHIGWFAAHPDYPGQQYGRKIQQLLEQEILIGQLRAPAVSLGTAINHPWLKEMYQKRGFVPIHTADLGKGHITLYMKKILDETAHQRWLARQSPAEGNQ